MSFLKRIFPVLVFLLMAQGMAVARVPETAFVKGVFDDMSAQKKAKAGKEDVLLKKIEGYYDFPAMFQRSIQDVSGQLSDDQRKSLQDLFVDLMARKIEQKSDRLMGRRLESPSYALNRNRADESVVEVQGLIKGKKVRLEFTLAPHEDSYRIVDLAVEGALLSRNYRGQFNRIYRVEGFEGLEKRLAQKQKAH